MNKIIIFIDPELSLLVVRTPAKGVSVEEAAPKDVSYFVMDSKDLPQQEVFRDAWTIKDKGVVVDLGKAREISHELRRKIRDKEFEPLDREVTIPGKAEVVETKRQEIRDYYDKAQAGIDSATTEDELINIMEKFKQR